MQGNVEKYKKVKWSEILLATLLSVYHTLYKHFKLCWDRTYIKCMKYILKGVSHWMFTWTEDAYKLVIRLFIVTLYHKNLHCWRYFENTILKDWIPFWPSASYCIPSAVCSCLLFSFSLTVLCTEHNRIYRWCVSGYLHSSPSGVNIGEALETCHQIVERLIFTPGFPAAWKPFPDSLCITLSSSTWLSPEGTVLCCPVFCSPCRSVWTKKTPHVGHHQCLTWQERPHFLRGGKTKLRGQGPLP